MKKYRIPDENSDLVTYARYKNIKYLLYYVLYVAFFTFAFAFYLSRRYEDADPLKWWVYPVFVAAVLVSGWMICCMYRFVGDRYVNGQISEMKLIRRYDRGLSRSAGFSLDDHTYLRITAIDRDGNKRKCTVRLFDDGYDRYYREGMEIIKFRGLNYPLCPSSEHEGAHLCSVCGVRTYYKEGKTIFGEAEPEKRGELLVCRSCRHTLMRIEKVERK